MKDNIVKKYTDLFRLKKISDGTIVEVEETGKYYIRNGHNWDEMPKAKIKEGISGPTMSLYELNQSSVIQFPPVTKEEFMNDYYEEIANWLNSTNQNYYMLLSTRYNYYTLFVHKEFGAEEGIDSLPSILWEILSNFSKVYSISFDKENNAWEIWACINMDDKAPEIFYLFPYEAGVVYYG